MESSTVGGCSYVSGDSEPAATNRAASLALSRTCRQHERRAAKKKAKSRKTKRAPQTSQAATQATQGDHGPSGGATRGFAAFKPSSKP